MGITNSKFQKGMTTITESFNATLWTLEKKIFTHTKAETKRLLQTMTEFSRAIEVQRLAGLEREKQLQEEMKAMQEASQKSLDEMDATWNERVSLMNENYRKMVEEARANRQVLEAMQQAFTDERKMYLEARQEEERRFQKQFDFLQRMLDGHVTSTTATITQMYKAINDIRYQLRQMSRQITMHLRNQSKLIELLTSYGRCITNVFSIIHNQQRVNQQYREEIMARRALAEQQNQICLQLIEEITRVRDVTRQISRDDLQKILVLIREEGRQSQDAELLISASQLMQSIADETLIHRIQAIEDPKAQQLAYMELLTSVQEVLDAVKRKDASMYTQLEKVAESIGAAMQNTESSKNTTLEEMIQNPDLALLEIASEDVADLNPVVIGPVEDLLEDEEFYDYDIGQESSTVTPTIEATVSTVSFSQVEVVEPEFVDINQTLIVDEPTAAAIIGEPVEKVIRGNGAVMFVGLVAILLCLVGIMMRKNRARRLRHEQKRETPREIEYFM